MMAMPSQKNREANQARAEFITDGMHALKLESHALHRFSSTLRDSDVIIEIVEGKKYVLTPPMPEDGKSMVGVSSFVPLSDLSRAAHKFVSLNAAHRDPAKPLCFTFSKNSLPPGLGAYQDMPLKFAPQKVQDEESGSLCVYPDVFQSMSTTQRKKNMFHGLHIALYPEKRMLFDDFAIILESLEPLQYGLPCKQGAAAGDWDPSSKLDFDQGQTSYPSEQEMRYVWEALYQYAKQSPDANDALLAHLLYHHIGNSDLPFAWLRHDCTFSRLVYRAMLLLEENPPKLVTAYSVCDQILLDLEAVIPAYLHRERASSDEETTAKGSGSHASASTPIVSEVLQCVSACP